MRGVNKVMLIGNAGKDPDCKTLQDGTAVAKINLATTESYRLKSGELQTSTDWHTIIAWRSLATLVEKYMHKGSLLYVEGKLKSRSYDTPEGKKYVTEIVAEQLVLLDKKKHTQQGLPEEIKTGAGDEPLPF